MYNNIGNIESVKTYPYTAQGTALGGTPTKTETFTYGDTANPDRLTKCGSTSINYNAIGCPTTYNGYSATWTRGKLSRLSKGLKLSGMHNYNYSYNALGQRIGRTYSYTQGTSQVSLGMLLSYNQVFRYDHLGRLVYESKVSQYNQAETKYETINYLYDENNIIGMVYSLDGEPDTYYFQRNLLGDVIGLYDTRGTKVAGYVYDAFGNCSIEIATTNTNVAHANPIRYRGYYYDEDTKLYCINSRYYSPEWRRFIQPANASSLNPDSVNGLNSYCYAGNNPVGVAYGTFSSGSAGAMVGGMVSSVDCSVKNGSGSAGGKTAFSFTSLPAVPSYLKHISKVNDVFSATAHSVIVGNYLFHSLSFIDDMIMSGNNAARALGYLSKAPWINKVGYVFSAIDGAITIYDNLQQGNSWGEALLDGALSLGTSAASAWVGGVVGANVGGMIGLFVGTLIPAPIVGTLAGFLIGTGVGIVVSWFVDDVLGLLKDGLLDLIFD